MRKFYGFCLAAPRSGEGKTTLGMGLMRAFRRRGFTVQGFKCGPDYIDPTFHTEATGRNTFNIDTWMMGEAGVQSLWAHGIAGTEGIAADMGICEGVMGLFDARRVDSLEGSTVHVAKVLQLPVILVFNAKGMGGSAAALVRGFYEQAKDNGVHIVGCIANNVGSIRHEQILRDCLEFHALPPLLGAMPRERGWLLPERQLGLVPSAEVAACADWYDTLAEAVEKHCSLDRILEVCAMPYPQPHSVKIDAKCEQSSHKNGRKKRLAVAMDRAFCFYYDENLRYLEKIGYELVPFSPLEHAHLPENIDAVYLGGGYPEVFAKELSENVSMRQSIYDFAQNDGEIYAECGGYMYLCTELVEAEGKKGAQALPRRFAMCNIIKATASMGKGVRSLGYRQAQLLCAPPLGLASTVYRGHEFHWSSIELHEQYAPLYSYEIQGKTESDGIIHKNVKAGYIHLYWGIGAYAS